MADSVRNILRTLSATKPRPSDGKPDYVRRPVVAYSDLQVVVNKLTTYSVSHDNDMGQLVFGPTDQRKRNEEATEYRVGSANVLPKPKVLGKLSDYRVICQHFWTLASSGGELAKFWLECTI